jgi:hypothetical protein
MKITELRNKLHVKDCRRSVEIGLTDDQREKRFNRLIRLLDAIKNGRRKGKAYRLMIGV